MWANGTPLHYMQYTVVNSYLLIHATLPLCTSNALAHVCAGKNTRVIFQSQCIVLLLLLLLLNCVLRLFLDVFWRHRNELMLAVCSAHEAVLCAELLIESLRVFVLW